jgi:hypothetical protein
MPTVLLFHGYRFYFYSRENGEPAHVHVESGDKLAKYWLSPSNWHHPRDFVIMN